MDAEFKQERLYGQMATAVDKVGRSGSPRASRWSARMRVLAPFGIIVGAILALKPAFAVPTAYFAGFALRGAAITLKQRFPYSYKIATEATNGENHIDAVIRHDLTGFHSGKFSLNLSGLGNLAAGQSTAVAFVLSRETIGQEEIGGNYKLYVQLSGSVLFFNFHGIKVEASYPVSVEYVDAFPTPPTRREIARDVSKLYYGDTSVNILRQYVAALRQADPRATGSNTLRLTTAKVLPEAMAHLSPFLRNDPASAAEFVAQAFDKTLVANQGVAVLPYVKDSAIGNAMALRFANGDVYSLSIPAPDYDIQLTVTGFRRFQFRKTAFASGWVYAAFGHLKIFEPLSDKIYLDDSFRDGVAKVIPNNEERVMNWPIYQAALLTLFDHATAALSNPGSSWARKASNNPEISQELQKVKDVLQSCR